MPRLIKMRTLCLLAAALAVFALLAATGGSDVCAAEKTVYLADGGNGDGSSYTTPMGDFKEAVRAVADDGGRIVLCGVYTYTELINLSDKSGTSNGNKTITVTSLDGERDYRVTDGAELRVGDKSSSANMILAGSFVFENITIVTNGSDKARAIICGGYDTVFGEGILCKKQGKAPYISVVGVSLGDVSAIDSCKVTIKSGTYNDVCAGNRDGGLKGNTTLVIEGGTFEGRVSASGVSDNGVQQSGECALSVFGGYFYGKAGALSRVDGGVYLKIDGGIFRSELIAMGKYNTVDINGGNMQGLARIYLSDYVADVPETDDEGKAVETDAADVRKSVININSYGGDVKKLAEKISALGAEIKINTKGGSDGENTAKGETGKYSPESGKPEKETVPESDWAENVNEDDRYYLLGSKSRTVVAAISLGSLMLLSALMLTYRSLYRKK